MCGLVWFCVWHGEHEGEHACAVCVLCGLCFVRMLHRAGCRVGCGLEAVSAETLGSVALMHLQTRHVDEVCEVVRSP